MPVEPGRLSEACLDRDSIIWAVSLAIQAVLTFLAQRRLRGLESFLLAIPSTIVGGALMILIGAIAYESVSNIWPIACAIYFLPGFLVGWLAAFIARQTGPKPIPPGCCQKCGYNLTGNISGRCPECGFPTGSGRRPPKAKRRR